MKNFISIIVPYYKKKKFIKKTLDSIYNQTYKNYEVILIYNDKNLDDLIYIKNLLKKFKKFRLLISKKEGVALARNAGIKKSLGNYIAFLDSDDIWRKDKLEQQISFMNKKNIYVSHTSYKIIGEKDEYISIRNAKNLNYNQLIRSCDIGLSSVMIKKNSKINIKFPKIKTKEDYVLWLKISKLGYKIYALKKPLTCWRQTRNSLSSSIIQKLLDGYRVYRVHENKKSITSLIYLLYLSINYIKKKFTL
jgi:teichuronic acid biosynthesis glycosyltransferase TuaG